MSETDDRCACCGTKFEEIMFDEHTVYARSLSAFACMKYCSSCNIKLTQCRLCNGRFSTFRYIVYVIILHYNNVHMDDQYYSNGFFDVYMGGNLVQTYGMGFIFPQTLLIKSTTRNVFPHNELIPNSCLNVDVISILNGNTQILKNGVKCNCLDEYVISEMRKSIYYCIVCLVVYEDGLPPLDLVVNHILDCLRQSAAALGSGKT